MPLQAAQVVWTDTLSLTKVCGTDDVITVRGKMKTPAW